MSDESKCPMCGDTLFKYGEILMICGNCPHQEPISK